MQNRKTISDHHTEPARFLQHVPCCLDPGQTPDVYRHRAPAPVTELSGRNARRATVAAGRRYLPPSVADAPLIGVPEGRFLE
jgi:hypothetical protein